MFHKFDDILSHAIVKVAMKNTTITRERNNKHLELQATARRETRERGAGKRKEYE